MYDEKVRQLLRQYLDEDLGSGDISSQFLADSGIRTGYFTARRQTVVAGLPFAGKIFELLGELQWDPKTEEGQKARQGEILAAVTGPGHLLLQGERVALNLLQRLSGIATQTREMAEAVKGYDVRITDTRKTTPGFRWFEKYAVRVGGGYNHRWGLYDAVMLKDNHIKLAGGIAAAVASVRENLGHWPKVEVETESLDQVREALEAKVDIIMLDNMTPEEVAEAVRLIDGRAVTEASGSIGKENLVRYAASGVNYISMGMLTHSVPSADIGFDLDEPKGGLK